MFSARCLSQFLDFPQVQKRSLGVLPLYLWNDIARIAYDDFVFDGLIQSRFDFAKIGVSSVLWNFCDQVGFERLKPIVGNGWKLDPTACKVL